MGQSSLAGREFRRFLSAVLSAAVIAVAPARAQTPPPLGYTLKTVSLIGPGYEHNTPAGIARGFLSLASFGGQFISPAGATAGVSNRINATGDYLGNDSWYFNGSSTSVASLNGAGYQYTLPQGVFRNSNAVAFDALGHVSGTSNRFTAAGLFLGTDAWLFNGSTTQLVSLSGGQYQINESGGVRREGETLAMDAAGHPTGFSKRYEGGFASDAGQDIWYFNGSTTQVINLAGGVYQHTSGSDIFRDGQEVQSTSTGRTLGFSTRYSSSGVDLGHDAWVFDGTTTTLVGLTGGVYEYVDPSGTQRFCIPDSINGSGHAVGATERAVGFSPLGRDCWYYNGSTTQAIGLTGGVYEYTTPDGPSRFGGIACPVTNSNKTSGVSDRYTSGGGSLGTDAWVFNGSTTALIGLTGAGYEFSVAGGAYRNGRGYYINEAGQVLGQTLRYSASGVDLGTDTWIYDGAANHRTNLSGAGYEYTDADGTHRLGDGFVLTSLGEVGGHSVRYAAGGTELGADVWIYYGGTTHRVNPTGGVYEKSVAGNSFREGTLHMINDATGSAIGDSKRYAGDGSGLGQAGWYYDKATDATSPLEFSYRTDGFCYTDPEQLTDSGVVLGSYDLYNVGVLDGRHAFWWSLGDGFHDLGSMVGGGLAGNGWDALIFTTANAGTSPGGSPNYILGMGKTAGEAPETPFTVFELKANVPEPAAAATLALASFVTLLARRRR